MTAITQIIDWINEDTRPIWWKHTIRLLLEESDLEKHHYELLLDIAKKEAGFIVDLPEYDKYNDVVAPHGFEIEEETVRLLGIGPVTNVSSIDNNQSISFQKYGMTVIYGDNGTGKSSYAKILKNACLTRGDKPDIVGNIFDPILATPCSKIIYQVGENDKEEINWRYKETEVNELKSIRVFDTKSAFHYVEKEDVLDYRPAGLHLLDELTNVCAFVRSNIDTCINKCCTKIELPKVDKETNVCKFLDGLGIDTTSSELDAHCISKDEEKTLENTKKEIAILKTKTIKEIKKSITKKILLYKPLKKDLALLFNAVNDNTINEIHESKKDLDAKLKASKLVRNEAFSNLPFEKVGSQVWTALWASAKNFISSLDNKSFPPKRGEYCPLCLQVISDSASDHMKSFEGFIQDDTQQQAKKAQRIYEEKIKPTNKAKIDLNLHKAAILDLKELSNDIDQRLLDFMEVSSKRREYILSEKYQSTERLNLPDIDKSIIDFIGGTIQKHEQKIEQLKDSTDVERFIKAKETLEKELTSKKIIKDCRLQVESEVKRLKSLAAYQSIKKQTNTRQISQLSSTISSIYLTSSLKEDFSNELKRLGFRYFQVNANTRNQKGSQLFGLQLADSNSTKVHTIASEGEQKCLAIASIFSELSSDGRKSCVVFDDPVNSLDHKWRTKVAKRLVEESLERQLIIFTHDIVFLKLLLEASELISNSKIDVKSLDRRLKTTGIIRANPPWDALTTSKRIKHLNGEFRKIKKILNEGIESEYDRSVSRFYGLLRETWERLVEEKLLNKVVERFGRAVQTQRLKRLVDISDDDIKLIYTEMGKCSSIFEGHDSAPELHENTPNIDEIQKDLNTIINFEQELSQKRKRS